MAAPTVPIEIWAYGNIVLPNTHELNKSRPIDDLWNKGWDMGEKPSCEEFNYVLNMVTAWAKYITGEQIPGLDSRFLRVTQNLADVPNKATARTNLDVWSKGESDTRYVNVSGDTMTGNLSVPRLDLQASSSDFAYITTTNPASDWTYFDFVLGDNPGTAGSSGVDTMRFRFTPSGGSIFNMMELNAISATAALCRVTGNIIASGSIQGSSMTATSATFTNGTVSNTWTVNTLQSTTTRATNVVATNNVSTGTLNVSSTTTTANLVVQNNSATVGGRHVVRAVNGNTADGNGNVTISLPPQGVQDMRLGSEISTNRYSLGNESFVYRAPGGCVVTGFNIWSKSGNNDEFRDMYSRPIQKYINGGWYTIGQL